MCELIYILKDTGLQSKLKRSMNQTYCSDPLTLLGDALTNVPAGTHDRNIISSTS